MRFLTVLAAAMLLCAMAGAAWAQQEVPLSQLKKVSGEWQAVPDATFRGKARQSVYRPNWVPGVEFALDENYDWLLLEAGFPDTVATGNGGSLTVVIDGEHALREEMVAPRPPKAFRLPVTGKARVVFRSTDGVCLINPRVVKGTPPVQPPSGQVESQVPAGMGAGPTSFPVSPATFAVDPSDLDKLAESLRKAVDEEPAAKERVGAEKLALATFDLVDIPSASVAKNVAEDLATAMIKRRFRVVERGQLDKILKELKIDNSGLIDPKTAKEIGNLTGCTLILVGSISDRGQSVVVNARLMETETGESVAAGACRHEEGEHPPRAIGACLSICMQRV